MHKEALQAGLADAGQRERAVKEAVKLLSRFKAHQLWQEIDTAVERYHELPYTRPGGRDIPAEETGYIDVLYRTGEEYKLVEFKTDNLRNSIMLEEMKERYLPQLRRYCAAVHQLMDVVPGGVLCFLDDRNRVTEVEG